NAQQDPGTRTAPAAGPTGAPAAGPTTPAGTGPIAAWAAGPIVGLTVAPAVGPALGSAALAGRQGDRRAEDHHAAAEMGDRRQRAEGRHRRGHGDEPDCGRPQPIDIKHLRNI